jgi:regulator of protease activity HflC (stomatin/prohibitin superfamily)
MEVFVHLSLRALIAVVVVIPVFTSNQLAAAPADRTPATAKSITDPMGGFIAAVAAAAKGAFAIPIGGDGGKVQPVKPSRESGKTKQENPQPQDGRDKKKKDSGPEKDSGPASTTKISEKARQLEQARKKQEVEAIAFAERKKAERARQEEQARLTEAARQEAALKAEIARKQALADAERQAEATRLAQQAQIDAKREQDRQAEIAREAHGPRGLGPMGMEKDGGGGGPRHGIEGFADFAKDFIDHVNRSN